MLTKYRIYTAPQIYKDYTPYEFVALVNDLKVSEMISSIYAVSVVKQSDPLEQEAKHYDEKKYLFRGSEEYSTNMFFKIDLLVKFAQFAGERNFIQQATAKIRELAITSNGKKGDALIHSINEIIATTNGIDAQLQTYSGLQTLCLMICAMFFCESDEPYDLSDAFIEKKVSHWRTHEPALTAFFLPIGAVLSQQYGHELGQAALNLAALAEQISSLMITLPPSDPNQQNL